MDDEVDALVVVTDFDRVEHHSHFPSGFRRDCAHRVQHFEHVGASVVDELLLRVNWGQVLQVYNSAHLVLCLYFALVELLAGHEHLQALRLCLQHETLAVA